MNTQFFLRMDKYVYWLRTCKISNILSILSGGKYYQKDGERRGYDPEVFSRIFWEQTKAEEEEERFVEWDTSVSWLWNLDFSTA